MICDRWCFFMDARFYSSDIPLAELYVRSVAWSAHIGRPSLRQRCTGGRPHSSSTGPFACRSLGMTDRTDLVHAEWDAESASWVAYGDDVPGLVTGADTLDALVQKLRQAVPGLLEANGIIPDGTAPVPFSVVAHHAERARTAA
jgi:predicted RNase H-like HicB family nuclease